MKKYFLIGFTIGLFLLTYCGPAQGQDVCPQDKVCISREAAQKAVENQIKVDAYEKAQKEDDKVIGDLRELLANLRVEVARLTGENTILKQNEVAQRAEREVLIKNTRKSCKPFSICL